MADERRFTAVRARAWFDRAFSERDLMIEWDVESSVDQILQLHPLFVARQMDSILSLPRQYTKLPV